jgi:hypothetical protein
LRRLLNYWRHFGTVLPLCIGLGYVNMTLPI